MEQEDRRGAAPLDKKAVVSGGPVRPTLLGLVARGSGMSRTRRSKVAGVLGALGALVAALLIVVATPQQASALPAVCSSGGSNVTVWTGGASTLNWDTAANWTNGVPDASDAIACVPSGKAVSRGQTLGDVTVNQLYIDSQLTRRPRCGEGHLLRRRHHARRTGGTGSVRRAREGRLLGQRPAQDGGRDGHPAGRPRPDPLRLLHLRRLGDGNHHRRRRHPRASHGSGGYYQGTPVAGQPIGRIISHGTISKTSGGSTSIIDADYAQGPPAQILVDCCATLAFAGSQVVSGNVEPNMSLGTGACGAGRRRSATAASTRPSTRAASCSSSRATAATTPTSRSRSSPSRPRHGLPGDRQRGLRPRRWSLDEPAGRGDDHAALLPGGRDEHPARRRPGRAHQRQRRDDQDAGLRGPRPAAAERSTASSGRSPARRRTPPSS